MQEFDIHKTAFSHIRRSLQVFGHAIWPSQCTSHLPTHNESFIKPFLRKFIIVFFHDILVYSPTLNIHYKHPNQVLSYLSNSGFSLKLSNVSSIKKNGVLRTYYLDRTGSSRLIQDHGNVKMAMPIENQTIMWILRVNRLLQMIY